MSLDAPSPAEPPTDPDNGLVRVEGIETSTELLPRPTRHGGNLHLVLNDVYRPETEIPHDFGDRRIRDGSAYQYARARWYEAQDDGEIVTVEDSRGREREYVVLLDEYELFGETVAVSLNSSRCELGRETRGGAFRQWFKYNLTLQPVEDGEIQWFKTPTTSLNVTLRPQYASLLKKTQQGISENWTPPYGDGTELTVQTTWAEDSAEIEDRAVTLLYDALEYDVDDLDVNQESRTFWKSEVHHRISEGVADEVVHVIRQSSELLARHEAELKEESVYSDGKWQIVKLRTDGWEQLGFPILHGQEIQIKLYLPDAPAEYLEYPYDQPKVEVSLEGRPKGGDAYSADRWEQITHILEQILLSHLKWADVGTEHILQDEQSLGPAAELLQWEHPEGRRAWLRDHYESLRPQLYAEARKAQTTAVYDILHSIKRRGVATYDEIAQDVGLVKRTVRGHVKRLCGTDSEPGILKTIPDACTFVTFSAQWWEEDAHEALDEVYPEDSAEDRHDRAQQRREKRFLKRTLEGDQDADRGERDALLEAIADAGQGDRDDRAGDQDGRVDQGETVDEDQDDADAVSSSSSESDEALWKAFRELPLTGEQLGTALEVGAIADEYVEVRTDPYPTLRD
ncbi:MULTISPECIES: hypothetical protein [Halorussus]|uniref:DUF7845 domain-containing protein n=1 Tax=Halorussus TaxID=1070314 RepID=UPI000E21098F|nr:MULTISPECIES: hypothetical protein [Halorussus]NHN59828.1 hypothetical protein [Halorussus sp. JP-T4]